MMERSALLKNSLIVAAHPDDEILWFSSIAADVDEIAVVYCDFWAQPQIGEQRREAFANFPRPITALMIPESGATGCANWDNAALTDYGMELGAEGYKRTVTRFARKTLSLISPQQQVRLSEKTVLDAYRDNALAIEAALRPKLRPGMNVFTHNPWGEYGHEEHIQIFRVLARLRREIGFRLWMTNYCTERSMPLARRYFRQRPAPFVRLACDIAFAERAADVYKRAGCWTWADDWVWFEDECFMEAPEEVGTAEPHHHLFPLNFFSIGPEFERQKMMPILVSTTAAMAALAVVAAD